MEPFETTEERVDTSNLRQFSSYNEIFYFNILLKRKRREVCCENKSVNMSDAWFGSCITHFLLIYYSIFNLISVDWVRKNQKSLINFSYWTNYQKSDCKLFFCCLVPNYFLYCQVMVGNLYRFCMWCACAAPRRFA